MAEQSWWGRVRAAIEREYERRIRKASEVSEYGAGHHAHHDDDAEAAVIMNVPRGTRLRPSSPPPQHPPADAER